MALIQVFLVQKNLYHFPLEIIMTFLTIFLFSITKQDYEKFLKHKIDLKTVSTIKEA